MADGLAKILGAPANYRADVPRGNLDYMASMYGIGGTCP
jgi:hypothetical protein